MAVGQHLAHGGDGAAEVVAVLGRALAFEGCWRRCSPSEARPAPALMPGAVTLEGPPLVLSIELVDFWLALTFSTICTVISVSPTRRARWSSNSGR